MMGRKRKLNLIAYSFTLLGILSALYVFGDAETRPFLLIGAGVGAAGILICMVALNTVRYLWCFTQPSLKPQPQPLRTTQVNASWVLAGRPVFSYVPYTASPDMHTGETGIWKCQGPASFDWHFEACDEVVYILSGEVEVDYLGRRFTLKAGDTATFFAHTQATWHVSGHVQKSYVLYLPNLAVRCYRRLFTSHFSKLPATRRRPNSIGAHSNL